jgi:Holliday junction resolvase RusA-like endonuclease
MEFTFDYKPESKQRPRFGARGKVYNPQRKKALGYKWEAARQMRLQDSESTLESPVCVNMVFHMPMPKSWSQKRKKEQFGKPMTSKPDIDNMQKFVLDILNGIAYQDDRYVTSGYFEKIWDYEGKAQISVNEQEMSLLEEIRIMGKAAVEMHEALDDLYQWAHTLKKTYPKNNQVLSCANVVIDKCLDGGLFEIYGEKSC